MSIETPAKGRILIIEDEPLIALDLEDVLVEAGFAVAGTAGNLPAALAMIASLPFDVAILDANLGGISAAPAARLLAARNLPFVVVSGYSAVQQPPEMRQAQSFAKPVDAAKLTRALDNLIFEGATRFQPLSF